MRIKYFKKCEVKLKHVNKDIKKMCKNCSKYAVHESIGKINRSNNNK